MLHYALHYIAVFYTLHYRSVALYMFRQGVDAYFQFNSMLIVARAMFTGMDMRAILCEWHYHHHSYLIAMILLSPLLLLWPLSPSPTQPAPIHISNITSGYLAAVCKGVSPKLFLRSGRHPWVSNSRQHWLCPAWRSTLSQSRSYDDPGAVEIDAYL